jgi:hypothetical protein
MGVDKSSPRIRRIRRNLTGRRFGRLTVLAPLPSPKGKNTKWLCSCRCGGLVGVGGSELTRPKRRVNSCGCLNLEILRSRLHDLTGRAFGRLTVVSSYGRNRHGQSQWLCDCTCGNVTVATGANLKTGNTQSCGCYHSEIAAQTQRLKRIFIPPEMTLTNLLSRLRNLYQ